MAQATTLTGAQKVAVLLMQVSTERSAKVLRTLRESEVAEVMTEIARLEHVPVDEVAGVRTEFQASLVAREHVAQGGIERARELLEESLGPDKAREILERLSASLVQRPFEFLRRADPRQVITYLQDEHPQTIALVLAHLAPDAGATVLSALPEQLQGEVAMRLASMDRTSPEVIEVVESVLAPKLSSVIQQSELATAGGVQALVDILNRADRATERLILEGLEHDDEELADEVRSRLFVFEDIVTLDDRAVQLVLREIDTKDLAVALKGVQPVVRDKVLHNLSERAAVNLVEEIELLGPVRMKTVEEAQGGIVRVIRALDESGQIVLSRTSDEFVV
jgi:flagellar motor switch protein FliG